MKRFQTKQKRLMLQKIHLPVKLMAIAFIAIGLSVGGLVRADEFQERINRLNSQNNNLQADRQDLLEDAESLQAVIDGLVAEINELTAQINANQAKMDALKVKIAETEVEIEKQRGVLGQSIRSMYLEGDITTLEMLASSKDLSEFLDKEQYRSSVQDKVKTTLDAITALRTQLKSQQEELDKRLKDQKAIQAKLDSQRDEQAKLLALNESERSNLDSKIRANSNKISDLRREQAIANARFIGGVNVPDTSGYPWPNVYFPNTMVDPWGMYKRQCVSYTAWKVWRSGRYMPYWGGHGNANQWDDNARADGIPVDTNPRVGDVAVSNAGYYGHVMYVEAVYGDGTIYISQYNASWTGSYSEARISAAGLYFIHF